MNDKLSITNHAKERFAERCTNKKPFSILKQIRMDLEEANIAFAVSYVDGKGKKVTKVFTKNNREYRITKKKAKFCVMTIMQHNLIESKKRIEKLVAVWEIKSNY